MTEEDKTKSSADEMSGLGFIEDVDIDYKDYGIEDYAVLAIFWLLAGVVFAQFFSRYILNDSIAWTEEISRYLLVALGFLGGSIAVRKNSHIYVEFFYRFLNKSIAKIILFGVDIMRIVFFFYCAYLTHQVIGLMKAQYMTAINVSMAALYWVVLVGFLLMGVRGVQVAYRHYKNGHSLLH